MTRGVILVDTGHLQITTCPDSFAGQRVHIYFKHGPGAAEGFPECWHQLAALELFQALAKHFESQGFARAGP